MLHMVTGDTLHTVTVLQVLPALLPVVWELPAFLPHPGLQARLLQLPVLPLTTGLLPAAPGQRGPCLCPSWTTSSQGPQLCMWQVKNISDEFLMSSKTIRIPL
ncbi:uncharacterized protein LOC115291418 isoform X3 [Suricata suricatta]|uniref:uncharacterized protein LOC115291418 isoform X3 n=1 Tax=Suricata suricatta TaxID=37032 RepID=UPI0011553E41|nr:uncharacterized protein LOC115291418 isoform X3 [Suricata suricatta]